MSAEDVLQWLRPFCAEDTCPVRPRVQVLQLLGQSFHLSEEDSRLLVFFRTEAILRAAWPQRQVGIVCTPVFPQIIGRERAAANNSCLGTADFCYVHGASGLEYAQESLF